jgi:hypothetical protein
LSAPGVPVPGADTTPLAEMRGRFRCDDASELAGGESVEVEVFFDIAASGFTSGGTVGTVAVELWPDVAGPHPEVGVFGVVVDRFGEQRPIEVPPGLEGIEGIEGVEGVEGFRGTVVVEDP